jgi:hypothetical protein
MTVLDISNINLVTGFMKMLSYAWSCLVDKKSNSVFIIRNDSILMKYLDDECGLIGERAGHGNCFWWLSRPGCLVVLVLSVSIKDRTDVGLCVVETLQLATYSGKPDTSAIPL